MTEQPSLNPIRLAGMRMLTAIYWINVPVLLLAGRAIGSPDSHMVAFWGALLSVIPSLIWLRRDMSGPARMAMAMTAMAFPALYIFLLRVHPWQMDMHMAFFAAMAALTMLLDRRALLVAAGVTLLHHLILNYVQPHWVFSTVSDLPRVLLHGMLVIMQTAMLWWVVTRLTALIEGHTAEQARSETLRIEADEAKARAERALVELGQARAEADRQREAEAARRAAEAADRRRTIADSLETRLGAVISELGQFSQQLSHSKEKLFHLMQRTTERSTELRAAHDRAKGQVRAVATDTERLAQSIHEVGASADHARRNAHQGAVATRALSPEVGTLTGTVDSASAIVAMISEIAAQSRTLSFNAGIEAARNGNDARGFAVVAAEMKTLATQTAQATRQIDNCLEDIRKAAASVSGAIDVAARSVETIDNSAATIAEEVSAQVEATSEIASAAEEMERQIVKAAEQAEALSGALIEAHVAMEQTDVAVGALSSQSVELQRAVGTMLSELRMAA